jgi:hypothetical protein
MPAPGPAPRPLLPLPTLILLVAALAPLSAADGTSAPADGDAAGRPATPAEVQAAIGRDLRQDPGLWADYDLDQDGKVSQIEVIACLAKRPAWLRDHYPDLFKRIDTDHDNAISFAELQAFAALADSQDFTLAQRPHQVAGPLAGGAGGQAGAGIEVGCGGNEASAAFMRQQAYVAGYQVVGGQYQPVIGVLGYGTVLTVGDVIITIVHGQH